MNTARDDLNKFRNLMDQLHIPYNNKLLAARKRQFLKHVQKHMEKCGNLSVFEEEFLLHLYKDILELSYQEIKAA